MKDSFAAERERRPYGPAEERRPASPKPTATGSADDGDGHIPKSNRHTQSGTKDDPIPIPVDPPRPAKPAPRPKYASAGTQTEAELKSADAETCTEEPNPQESASKERRTEDSIGPANNIAHRRARISPQTHIR
jgi:hypothetical protein